MSQLDTQAPTKATIISLCDYSGRWPQPYADTGHTVVLVDPKHNGDTQHGNVRRIGMTVRQFLDADLCGISEARGVLAAPPCTHFTNSGAQYWKAKDADGRTAEMLEIVDDCLKVVDRLNPFWWCLENPAGRLPKLWAQHLDRPFLSHRPVMWFDPCEYAGHADKPESEAYTKKTGLWGWFCPELEKAPIEPRFVIASNGDKYSEIHWKSWSLPPAERAELRSNTPQGFARAFFAANQ